MSSFQSYTKCFHYNFFIFINIIMLSNAFTIISKTTITSTSTMKNGPILDYTTSKPTTTMMKMMKNKKYTKGTSFLQMSSSSSQDNNDNEEQDDDEMENNNNTIMNENIGMSFDEATAALKEQEDKERAAARGAMFEEVSFKGSMSY